MYYYIWPDGTISIVKADDQFDAADILDEIGDVDYSHIKELPVHRFMVTFAGAVCPSAVKMADPDDDGLRVAENGEHSEELDKFLGDTFDVLRSMGKLKNQEEKES